MKTKFWIISLSFAAILTVAFFFDTNSVLAQENDLEINLFYSSTCPHCKAEKEFLSELQKEFPKIDIKQYEIISSVENQKILLSFYKKYNVPENEWGLVPVTFTSEKYFIGFSEQIGQEIRACIQTCMGNNTDVGQKVKVPFLGEVDISKMSLPVLTAVLGFSDGLNPCAMWVLIFLISILINTRSKKRIWLVGGTFILASGFIYFLILSAWLNLFLAISYVNLTRILIGLFALGFGIWQIKNFVTYSPGVCKVLGIKSKIEKKLKMQEKVEKIAIAPVTWGIIGGLIILALGVNLIEFFCSAGIPAIYTRVLTLSGVGTLAYYFYLLGYVFFFMLDDLIIFAIAAFTLNQINISEKYNYWSTLIGGLLILVLGILLIFKPELLMFA